MLLKQFYINKRRIVDSLIGSSMFLKHQNFSENPKIIK